ncbi:non-homologous end-joining DNA ligase [Paraburkholderia acidipaludis]|uniref:non-homologous end-joining DNA ligase n=1 Tax=Paraburkholderia acidipaludis TaxID=660537 RepID=UPI00047F1207|nr:non-homologous end-joining DNA ligase [Paraburkholderia acidipaludis]
MQHAPKQQQASPARKSRRPRPAAQDTAAEVSRIASAPRSPSRGRHTGAGTEIAGVPITSERRVIDPASGIHKLDLVRYYARAAPRLLRHLAGRPVSVVRAPRGLSGDMFFQRHNGRPPIPWVTEHEDLDPGHPPLITIDTRAALIGAVQMDVIELHTWNARATDIERPDRVVFDLDPDPALGWDRMIEAAEMTRALLHDLGLESFCKTSGGKGLHVVVPLVPQADWEDAKAFARAVAQHLAATAPTQITATMGPEHRRKRIFVDYLRNARGASTAVAYGVRARSGMGISVPISWAELGNTTGGAQWTLHNIDERLTALARTDPWAGYASARQQITAELTIGLEGSGK